MVSRSAGGGWKALEAEAHRPAVQEVIRQEISQGTIRVVPGPGGGIRIIPRGADNRPHSGVLTVRPVSDNGLRGPEPVLSEGMLSSRDRSRSHS